MHIIRTPFSLIGSGVSSFSFKNSLDKQSTARKATAASLSLFAPVGTPLLSTIGSISLVLDMICNNFFTINALFILKVFAAKSIWAWISSRICGFFSNSLALSLAVAAL